MTSRGGDAHSAELLGAGLGLANEAATGELAGALRTAGLRGIVLKGPPLKQWLYGPDAVRPSMDVDLLVREFDVGAVEALLARLGWRYLGVDAVGRGRAHRRIWERPENGIILELHRTIAGIDAPSGEAWNALAADTEQATVGGVPAEVLGTPARAMHVALHAAQHGAGFERTLADLRFALEKLPRQVWDQAAALADRLEATPAFVAGLGLLPEGVLLLERLEIFSDVSTEIALRARGAPPMTEGLDWLMRSQGLRGKASFIASQFIPPTGYMRVWSPLARRGRLGLAAAYLGRPVWLIARSVPALVAWRRARRQAQRSRRRVRKA